MNTAGQIGGTLSPIIFAWVTQQWDSVYALGIIGALYLAGAVCWIWVKAPATAGTSLGTADAVPAPVK